MSELKSYAELLAARKELDKQVEAARAREAAEGLAAVKRLIADFGFTESQVFSRLAVSKKGGAGSRPTTPKYRNPQTGDTWSGLGKPPKWIPVSKEEREAFLINR